MQEYHLADEGYLHPVDCLGLFSLRVNALTALSVALRERDGGRNDPVLTGAAAALDVLEGDFEELTEVVGKWFRERTGSSIGDPWRGERRRADES